MAYKDGRLIEGGELEQALLEHYKSVHTQVPGFESTRQGMPQLRVDYERVLLMMSNVSQGKAIVMDGVTEKWFQVGSDYGCMERRKAGTGEYCEHCQRKIQFATSLLNHSYWGTADSKRHHKARLICLNKVYPRIPQLEQYRPIVASSPIIKFIEGYIAPSLSKWMKTKMPKNSYGFKPDRGIEDARMNLLYQFNSYRTQKQEIYVIFFDLVSAYDKVVRPRLKQLLVEFEVLDQSQIALWEWLVGNQTVQLGAGEAQGTNGIPQGSTLAPGLWNVYMTPLVI